MTSLPRLLKTKEVASLLRYDSSDAFLRARPKLEAQGFPAPALKRVRVLCWRESDIRDWLDRQHAA